MSRFRPTPSLVVATLALLVSASGFAVASTLTPSGTIAACASKRTGVLRLAPRSGHCGRGQRAVVWNQHGPAGPTGQGGGVGQAGAAGAVGPAGSPDTAAQVLAKVKQVDGPGSGLDADTLQGLPATAFLPVGATAADSRNVAGTPGADVVVGRRITTGYPQVVVPGRTTTSADRAVLNPNENALLANYFDGRNFGVTCAPDALSASIFFQAIANTTAVVSQSDVTAASPPFTAIQTVQDVGATAVLTAHRSSLFIIQSGSGSSHGPLGSNTVQTLVATVVDNGTTCTAMTQEINAIR